jgi:hypothetical protein
MLRVEVPKKLGKGFFNGYKEEGRREKNRNSPALPLSRSPHLPFPERIFARVGINGFNYFGSY